MIYLRIENYLKNEKYLCIQTTPNASKNRIGEYITDDNEKKWLKIYIKAPAKDQKANQELIKFLSEIFHYSKSHFSIVSGEYSKKKMILFKK